jgi:hypothetical protein
MGQYLHGATNLSGSLEGVKSEFRIEPFHLGTRRVAEGEFGTGKVNLEPERCIWNRKGAFGTGKRPKNTTKKNTSILYCFKYI